MTARDEAIEAAATAIYGNDEHDWEMVHEDTRDDYRRDARRALAAAVPVLLNDLADRIEAGRLHDEGDPEDNAYNCAISDALGIVRAAAEGWGA